MRTYPSTRTFSRRAVLAGLGAGALAALAPRARLAGAQSATSVATPGVQGDYATVNGAELYYELHGPEDGAVVQLVNGFLGHTGNWSNQIPALVGAGYRVVAFDNRAEGRSTWGDLPPTVPQLALDAVGLLDHLGIDRANVLGWSKGGVTALELAVTHGDRLDRAIVGAAVYSTEGGLTEIRPSDEMPPFEQITGDYQRLSPAPERMEELLALDPATPRVFAEAELTGIAVPVLVLDGAEEEFIDTGHTEEMAALIPGAQLVLMPGTGHFAPWAHPEEFNRIVLAFLAGEAVGPSTAATPSA